MKIQSTLIVFSFYCFNKVLTDDKNSTEIISSSAATPQPATETNLTKKTESTKKFWYGEKKNLTDTFGCEWPDDFQKRYNFCVEKHLPSIFDKNTHLSDDFGQGILNKNIMESLLNCGNNCDQIDQKQLENQIKIWWSNIESLAHFKTCLKHNTEASVKMCGSESEISQIMSGMAGLYLNLLDIVFDTYAGTTELNETNQCAIKMAESVHFTAAQYVTTQYYWQNSVLCWEVTTKTSCQPLCKRFATVLQCVGATCPHLSTALPRFAIWQWYFKDVKIAQTTCNMAESDTAKCLSDKVSVTGDDHQNPNATQAQRLFESVKEKLNEFKTQVESSLHIPFYIFLIITLSSFAIFTIVVLLICLWFNGVLGGRKTKVIRYAKLLNSDNNKLRVNVDETKSLTGSRDFDDDIE